MRTLATICMLSLLMACDNDAVSYISISNNTPVPIYAIPYSSEYSDGDWINPKSSDEFYSLGIDNLDGFDYFLAYYDSLLIFIKDHEKHPVKFYPDGTTINYSPELNPFTNRDVWDSRVYSTFLRDATNEDLEEKTVFEDYFTIELDHIISLSETEY